MKRPLAICANALFTRPTCFCMLQIDQEEIRIIGIHMNNSVRLFGALLVTYLLCSCGGGGTPHSVVSSGLKIFATAATHSGDFLQDTSLAGSTAIEKADSFCETDANRPDLGTYKAILVDGVNRDALVPLDWVLKPNTTYYQVNNNVQIGTTSSAALFGQNLTADIHDSFGVSGGNNSNTSTVWTGFADGVSFTTGQLTCSAWTNDGSDGSYAPYGISYGTDGTEWYTNGGQVCSLPSRLYCAEQ